MREGVERVICLEELRERVAQLEAPRRCQDSPVGSGCEAVDKLLPDGGFRRGSLVEWLAADEGIGASTLALLAAREACQDGGMLAVLDARGEFCPTAVVRLGIGTEQLLVIRPQGTADHDWAVDQVLHSPAIGAALVWPRKADVRTLRRWQLAAEAGGTLGLLLRPEAARSEPSWADVRLLVECVADGQGELPIAETSLASNPWHTDIAGRERRFLRITLLRCRGATAGRCVEVELDDETYRVHPLEQRRLPIAN
ncbi:MAG: hypothetical protein LLG00_07350 [Planctomycetaceae bacterium]|nr:hypothetical protein [Planctomycetaceae bacterium]